MDILTIAALALGAIGGYFGIRSKIRDSNVSDLKDRVVILEDDRKELRELLERERELASAQHLQNQKAISNLEGQLATYKEIPLKSIATSLEAIPKLVSSNQHILETLETSAKIAKKDRAENKNGGGVLVKTEKENPLAVKPVKEK